MRGGLGGSLSRRNQHWPSKTEGAEDEVWSLADWLRNTEQRVQNRTAGDWELIYVYWPWLWQPDLVHVLVGETPFEKNSQDRGASVAVSYTHLTLPTSDGV